MVDIWVGMEKCQRQPNCICSVCSDKIYRRPFQIAKGPVYCSHECRGKAQQRLHKCTMCDNQIQSGLHKKTCSRACANKQKVGSTYKTGRPIKDKVKSLAELRKRIVDLRGYKCERCSYSKLEILEIHHKIEKSKGGSDDIDNLELICPNCHAEEHYLRRLGNGV